MALFLFILAIQLMKEGAKALAPTLTNSPLFSNPFSTLGAGWLGAYIVLSGSPVAAVALSLYVGGVSTELQTFTMLSGSRLGASFVVLLVGFLYAVRNRGRNRMSRSAWASWRCPSPRSSTSRGCCWATASSDRGSSIRSG